MTPNLNSHSANTTLTGSEERVVLFNLPGLPASDRDNAFSKSKRLLFHEFACFNWNYAVLIDELFDM